MELSIRKDHNGHCALEFERGFRWTKYIANTEVGPRVFSARTQDFDRDFKVVEGRDAHSAALSFLGIAHTAYEYNFGVIDILLGIIMSKQTADMTIADIVRAYNEVAGALRRPPKANFKTKAEGLTALDTLDREAREMLPAQQVVEVKKEVVSAKRQAAKPKTEGGKRPGVGAFCVTLIKDGKSNEEVLAEVLVKWPEAKTSKSCIAYYRSGIKTGKY